MNENGGRGNTILLTVIGIATLLVVVVGATFAYFAAQVEGNNGTDSIRIQAAANGITVTQAGGEEVTLENIFPRDKAWLEKDLTITTSIAAAGATSKTKTTWNLFVDDNTFAADDIKFTFTKKSDATIGTVSNQTETSDMTSLKTGKNQPMPNIASFITADNSACTVVYTLRVYFVNKNVNQNTAGTDDAAPKVVFHLESVPSAVVTTTSVAAGA